MCFKKAVLHFLHWSHNTPSLGEKVIWCMRSLGFYSVKYFAADLTSLGHFCLHKSFPPSISHALSSVKIVLMRILVAGTGAQKQNEADL